MSRGVNKVILLGNLGRDPEVSYTQSGTAVCKFSLATTESRKKGDTWEDHTEWHNIVIFGKNAENSGKYLTKGSTAFIEGRIQTRKWQDKEGKDRYTTEILADSIRFVGGRSTKGEGSGRDFHTESSFPSGGGEPPEFDPNDDVPF